jgi:hypothetical protein
LNEPDMLKYTSAIEHSWLKPALGFTLLFLIFVSLACQTITPKNGSEKVQQVIFQDTFSDPTSGWNQVTSAKGISNYADGMYRIQVNETNTDVWANPGIDLADAVIEVDALKVGGERDNRYGVICRVGADKFYAFLLSSDGYFGIGKIIGMQSELIGMDAMQSSSAIHLGSETNHIRADCIGNTLTLYVNGQKLAEVHDSEFTTGDVGLIAGAYNLPGVDIRFDNFIVTKP